MSFSFKRTHIPQSYAARTDVGSVREHNEDSYLAKSPLFVVADGMGGHEAGEVASKIAVDTMSQRATRGTTPESLAAAVIKANEAVIEAAKSGIGKPGMGTTMTAATVFDDEVIIAQVGDSRAYLLHDGKLQRITRDHSLMADLIEQGRLTEAEARFHPQRSVITRALGSDPNMQPDTFTLQVEDGDRLMLCSDGLCSMIADDIIETILASNPSPASACDALVDEALAAGGLDNITVVVIDPLGDPFSETVEEEPEEEEIVVGAPPVQEDEAEQSAAEKAAIQSANKQMSRSSSTQPRKKKQKMARKPKHSQKGSKAPFFWALAFVLILVAAGFGFYTYAQNSYFLIAENNVVSIYRGLPGQIGTFSVSWLEEQAPDIDVSKLNPSTQNRLTSGISVNSLEEAQKLVSEYRQTTANSQRAQSATSIAVPSKQSTSQDETQATDDQD